MRRIHWLPVVAALVLLAVHDVRAVDITITGRKLVVIDKTSATGEAKVVFVARDEAIAKGAGTDPAQIEAQLDVGYDSVNGTFAMPQGAGWVVNLETIARYENEPAPTGGAVKVGVIKPGKLVKVVGKSLGDTALDVTAAPQGAVYVVHTVTNGAETTRHCTQFAGCAHETIAGGTGHKLVCRGGSSGDPSCIAALPFPTCPGPVDTDCGTCAFGCVLEHGSGAFVCVDPTQCDQETLGCTATADCPLAGQACIEIPPIAGGIGTICCSPCPAP